MTSIDPLSSAEVIPGHPYAGRTFTVSRATWARGKGPSYLLSLDTGKRCCLGFVAAQCGLSDNRIREKLGPLSIRWNELLGTGGEVLSYDSAPFGPIIGDMMNVNDDRLIPSDSVREAKLIALAARLGITLTFVP